MLLSLRLAVATIVLAAPAIHAEQRADVGSRTSVVFTLSLEADERQQQQQQQQH